MTEKLKFEQERVEDIQGKGKNAGYQHFLLFPQCFCSLHRVVNSTQQQDFKPAQIKSICRRQNKNDQKIEISTELPAGYQHFLLSPHCFQKAYFTGSFEGWDRVRKT